jgi:hypothetical protein
LKITDIAAKLLESVVDKKIYCSPRFDVFFHGSHKLYLQAHIQGNNLGLFIVKDVRLSDSKSHLDVTGTSFTVKKNGLPDVRRTFSGESLFVLPSLGYNNLFQKPNWFSFSKPLLTQYTDNDVINITVNLKLNESIIL